jgi:hypothetical protein
MAFRASFDWIVYCGAFVAQQLKDMPEVVRQLPLGRTPEGGTFPLLVVAVSPVTGERRLLDLRGIERPAPAPPVGAATIPLAQTDIQTDAPATPVAPPAAENKQTDGQTDVLAAPVPASAPSQPATAVRSREDIVRLLVAQGWSVSQIREVVKGDNATLGALVRQIEDERFRGPSNAQPA